MPVRCPDPIWLPQRALHRVGSSMGVAERRCARPQLVVLPCRRHRCAQPAAQVLHAAAVFGYRSQEAFPYLAVRCALPAFLAQSLLGQGPPCSMQPAARRQPSDVADLAPGCVCM